MQMQRDSKYESESTKPETRMLFFYKETEKPVRIAKQGWNSSEVEKTVYNQERRKNSSMIDVSKGVNEASKGSGYAKKRRFRKVMVLL